MAKFTPETEFIRGGGNSPADCVLYGSLSSDAGETFFRVTPGNPEDGSTPQEGSVSMREMKFCHVECTTKPGAAAQVAITYNAALQTDTATVTVNAADVDQTWIYKCEGRDNGQ